MKGSVALVKESTQLGCESQDSHPRNSIFLRKCFVVSCVHLILHILLACHCRVLFCAPCWRPKSVAAKVRRPKLTVANDVRGESGSQPFTERRKGGAGVTGEGGREGWRRRGGRVCVRCLSDVVFGVSNSSFQVLFQVLVQMCFKCFFKCFHVFPCVSMCFKCFQISSGDFQSFRVLFKCFSSGVCLHWLSSRVCFHVCVFRWCPSVLQVFFFKSVFLQVLVQVFVFMLFCVRMSFFQCFSSGYLQVNAQVLSRRVFQVFS